MIGTRLGPYEIVAPIGTGGMGEVYRTHDTHLGRDVAIKVLPTADATRSPSRSEDTARTPTQPNCRHASGTQPRKHVFQHQSLLYVEPLIGSGHNAAEKPRKNLRI